MYLHHNVLYNFQFRGIVSLHREKGAMWITEKDSVEKVN